MRDRRNSTVEGTVLCGLDGGNPLGFLAALGVLRILSIGYTEKAIRMAWCVRNGVWCPTVNVCGSEEAFVEQLVAKLSTSDASPWSINKRLPFEADRLRSAICIALQVSRMDERQTLDMLAAFGSEAFENAEGVFADTALRMVRAGDSAGQGLLAYGKRIREETSRQDLHEALFAIWRHQDSNCAVRWDPVENRSYALRWTDPSKERTGSVRGANRLALEGMPVLPVIPIGTRVRTTGFTEFQKRSESLTWPLWSAYATLDVVRSLVTLAELQNERPSVHQLGELGIAAVFRSSRIMMNQYYYNFTPAQRIA